MTKKIILECVLAVALAVGAGFGMTKSINGKAYLSGMALNSIEALANSECIASSDSNAGTCKQRTDGLGDSCVKAGFWDTKNCSGQI